MSAESVSILLKFQKVLLFTHGGTSLQTTRVRPSQRTISLGDLAPTTQLFLYCTLSRSLSELHPLFLVFNRAMTGWRVPLASKFMLESWLQVLRMTDLETQVFTEVMRKNEVVTVGLLQYDWCPHQKGELGHRDTQRGKTIWRPQGKTSQGERLQTCYGPQESAPQMPWFWTSSF